MTIAAIFVSASIGFISPLVYGCLWDIREDDRVRRLSPKSSILLVGVAGLALVAVGYAMGTKLDLAWYGFLAHAAVCMIAAWSTQTKSVRELLEART